MCVISNYIFKKIFGRNPQPEQQTDSAGAEKFMGPGFADLIAATAASCRIMDTLPREELAIVSDDGLTLKGYLFRNENETDKTAVCVHGYNSTGFVDFATVGLRYIRHGFNLLLVTNRACGESSGRWTTFGIKESDDLMKWIDKMTELFPDGDIILQGCSLGAAAVCMTADKALPMNVKALVSDCSFTSMRDEFTCIIESMMHLPAKPLIHIMARQFRRHTGCDFDGDSPLKCVSCAAVPMFFVHGEMDRYIPCDNSRRLYEACPTDKELLIVAGAGHAAAHLRGGEDYYRAIFAFIGRFMALPAAADAASAV